MGSNTCKALEAAAAAGSNGTTEVRKSKGHQCQLSALKHSFHHPPMERHKPMNSERVAQALCCRHFFKWIANSSAKWSIFCFGLIFFNSRHAGNIIDAREQSIGAITCLLAGFLARGLRTTGQEGQTFHWNHEPNILVYKSKNYALKVDLENMSRLYMVQYGKASKSSCLLRWGCLAWEARCRAGDGKTEPFTYQ